LASKVLGFCIAISFVIAACAWSAQHSLKASYGLLCDIVEEGYFRKSENLEKWSEHCHLRAEKFSSSKKQKLIDQFNLDLELLHSSHLFIYSPQENQQMWDNQALDNGLRVRQVEDSFLIYDIVKGSAAAQAELQVGDEIEKIEGRAPLFDTNFSEKSGLFEITRMQKNKRITLRATLQAASLAEDLSPRLSRLRRDVGLLKVGSFLPQYFDKQKWQALAEQLPNYKKIVIDVRGNAGGSFPAMLRVLSPFFCKPTFVGSLSSQLGLSNTSAEPVFLQDDLNAQNQIEQLDQSPRLSLQTFSDYGCVHSQVVVLVDSGTSSVSEIFAQALSQRPQTKVWGMTTAGQVVMARWFDLTALGFADYSLSLPIATYLTVQGREMEAQGFTPSKFLFYDLAGSRLGLDTWVEQAISK
jgi:carboxyl-terminal processing protease